MERLRKAFAIGVILTTVLSMSVVVVPNVGAAASAGDLIKMDGLSSVYYLAGDGKRYVFPNEQTYFSWYSDFSMVKTIPQLELESYPLGKNVTMRPGTKLVKITTDPKVYAVEPNGNLVWIPSEAVAATLYGADWARRIVDVPDGFFTNYTVNTSKQVAATAYPIGCLVKWAGSSDVYYMSSDGKAQRIASEMAFSANRFNWNFVLTAPSSVIMPAAGADITGAVASITDTSSGAGGSAGAGSGLIVALASDTPAGATTLSDSTAGDGAQALVPVTKVNFTAAQDGVVKVTTLKFKRGGVPSADADFAEFYLYEGDTLLAKYNSISSGVLTFTNSAGLFTVPAGQTKGVTLKVSLAAGLAASRAYNFAVNAASDVVTDGAAVSGSFPMTGNTMTCAQVGDLGKLTVADIAGLSSPDPGALAHIIWKFSLAAADQDIEISRLKFTIIGTVSASDLANFKLDVGGVTVGSTVATMASDKTIIFDLATPYLITKGNTKNFNLRADIMGGTSRTYQVYIYDKEDIVAKDVNYNVFVTPNQTDTYTKIKAVAATTINAGSLSISKNVASPSGSVALGATGVEIGKFDLKAVGEDIKVNSVWLNTTLSTSVGLYNVKLYVDGSQIGTAKNLLIDGTGYEVACGNSLIVPAGQTKTLVVKADMKEGDGTDLTADETLAFSLSDTGATKSTDFTKVASGGTGTTGTIAGNTMTVRTGTVSIAENTAFGDRHALLPSGTANAANVVIGSFVITAGAGEGIDVTQITLKDASATTQVGDNFQNLMIKNGTTQLGNTISNPDTSGTAATYDFSPATAIRINAGQQYVVTIYADIKSSPQDAGVSLSPAILVDAISANGVTTNSSAGLAAGQNLSLQVAYISTAGTLRVTTDPDTPLADDLLMGATDQEIAKFKFAASASEDIRISEVIVSDNNASVATGSLQNLKLYSGDTLLAGPVQFMSTGTTTFSNVKFSGLSLVIPKGANVVLTVKADVSTAGSGATSASSHAMTMVSNTGITATQTVNAAGVSSGTTLTYAGGSLLFGSNGTTDQAASTFKVYKTKITVAWASDTPSGAGQTGSAAQIVGKVNVTNTANVGSYSSTVKLMNVTISSTISNTVTRNLKIYKDAVSGTALITTAYGVGTGWGASAITEAGFDNVEISSGGTKTFFLVLDTSDAATNKTLSVYVDTDQITWNDGVYDISTGSLSRYLPLANKSFAY